MDSNIHVSEFDTFFVPNRTTTQFLRVISFNPEVQASIKKYYMEAVHAGVVIEGELQNPTPQQLTYYNEIMPSGFKLDVGFISDSLRVWLPRMNSTPRTRMSEAIYDVLTGLRKKRRPRVSCKTHISKLCVGFIISSSVFQTELVLRFPQRYCVKQHRVCIS